jgi:hypothetical protein
MGTNMDSDMDLLDLDANTALETDMDMDTVSDTEICLLTNRKIKTFMLQFSYNQQYLCTQIRWRSVVFHSGVLCICTYLHVIHT